MIDVDDTKWEMVVPFDSLIMFSETIKRVFHGAHVDECYDPFEPRKDDVDYFGEHVARELYKHWLYNRAHTMILYARLEAAAFYANLRRYGLSTRTSKDFPF
ncbi:hypothetical protein Plec18167_006165 [Paecilomyces lecythidis]|uniref:Uncharacterized protein n=1 Tax=Paecilomyces lecythidis TaxID=3004212 RepID=A0ABR3XCG3_9EURO